MCTWLLVACEGWQKKAKELSHERQSQGKADALLDLTRFHNMENCKYRIDVRCFRPKSNIQAIHVMCMFSDILNINIRILTLYFSRAPDFSLTDLEYHMSNRNRTLKYYQSESAQPDSDSKFLCASQPHSCPWNVPSSLFGELPYLGQVSCMCTWLLVACEGWQKKAKELSHERQSQGKADALLDLTRFHNMENCKYRIDVRCFRPKSNIQAIHVMCMFSDILNINIRILTLYFSRAPDFSLTDLEDLEP